MKEQGTQAQATSLPTSVLENPGFYALRPDWLESDSEREQFKSLYPELVEKYADCWQAETVQA